MTIRRSFRNDCGTLRRLPYRRGESARAIELCKLCESLEPQYDGGPCERCEAEIGVGA